MLVEGRKFVPELVVGFVVGTELLVSSVSGHQVVYSVTTPFVVVVMVESTALVVNIVELPLRSVVVKGISEVLQSEQTDVAFVELMIPLSEVEEGISSPVVDITVEDVTSVNGHQVVYIVTTPLVVVVTVESIALVL